MRVFAIALLFMLFSTIVFAQIRYSAKVESGYMGFSNHTINFDAGEDFKGYNLDKEQNGIEVNLVNGISFASNKGFVGVGVGYVNFEGINGLTIFSEVDRLIGTSKITPIISFKLGYNHIWNQYEGGKGTALCEFAAGVNYRLSHKVNVFLKFGKHLTQQSVLVPLRIGVRF